MTSKQTVTISDITISKDLSVIQQYLNHAEDVLLILLCQTGRLRIDFQEKVVDMLPNDLLFTTPRDVIGHYMSTPDVNCIICVTPMHLLKDVVFSCLRTENNWYDKFAYIKHNPLIHLADEQLQLFGAYVQLIYLHNQVHHTTNNRSLHAIKNAIFYEFMSLLDNCMLHDKTNLPTTGWKMNEQYSARANQLFYQFAKLLSDNYMRRLPVNWYADEMAITPKYLTFICRQAVGKTPSALIDEVTMQEIKSRLLNTSDTVKEIAYTMNYSSASSFCKFFRQQTGMSPLHYRQQHRKQMQ